MSDRDTPEDSHEHPGLPQALADPDRYRLGAAYQALVTGDHSDPFSLLGAHASEAGVIIRVFHPDAEQITILDAETRQPWGALRKVHDEGLFAGLFQDRELSAYRLHIDAGRNSWQTDDPYRFPPLLSDLEVYLIAEGTHLKLYDCLGARAFEQDGSSGTLFSVWAPNAKRVSVVGDFNNWDGRRHVMRFRPECGVWELFVPDVHGGALYKFEIKAKDGTLLPLKADPLAKRAELRPMTASVVHDMDIRAFQDATWMEGRGRRTAREAPISIYEVHLGSWQRMEEDDNRYLTYDEIGDRLIPYAKELGFTHLELLPITEHPFDGSWGYQPLGLFAPTSRHGTPHDFARFIARCHKANLGVLIDWVPAHFPSDPHGLAKFDGTRLYEHADPRLGFHQDWNTLIYNFGRREVGNFLIASALYWLDKYHIDGLRMDAVASMLYLDYSRQPGQWIPNKFGGNENLEAIDFIKQLNTLAYQEHPGIMTIAEESTAFSGVSRPVDAGGLGFGYKWNMGWMNDTLRYMSHDPIHRRHHHHDLTFGLLYAFSENFILPLSHDEVVHGKGSIISRMPGDRWQKFANLRAYYTFMFAHPGKKLLFMSNEFGQEREWDHDSSIDWNLMPDRHHGGVRTLITDLNTAYRQTPALHQGDCVPEGFEWVAADDAAHSVYAFLRYGFDREQPVLAVFNFTPVPRHFYRIGVPFDGPWHEILNSDSMFYGGSNQGNHGTLQAEAHPMHGRPYSLSLNLPPLSGLLLRPGRKE